LTSRQVRRLARRYAAAGPVGLISKRFSRSSNNRLDDDTADRVIKLLRSTYADFGPTLATEKLRTKHGIDLAKETDRRLQIAVGLWIPRKLRPPKIQQPRLRRACIGELIQIDGCEHHWFEDRGPACTALVFIDDATSRLMQILFNGTESTFGYFEATRRYIDRHGKPLAFQQIYNPLVPLLFTVRYSRINRDCRGIGQQSGQWRRLVSLPLRRT
jgi:hypothetical protein